MNKRLFYSLVFLLFFQSAAFCGILENPRTLNSISTEHFDIFFTEESTNSASLVADSADSLFAEALKVFPLEYQIRLVVVISPDSDELFMQYTPLPYNRIIIYDGVPYAKDFEYENTFKTMLKEQIFRAVMACVKNKFWQVASFWLGGDSLQPVTTLNMPFAFFEGAADFSKDYNPNENDFQRQTLNDLENYSLLVQAKLDGEFPSIFKMYGAMDSYPKNKVCTAALSAFCAFIQQKYGIQKFADFWKECGHLIFFKLHERIFKTVYGVSIEDEWKAFENSIELPSISSVHTNEFATKIITEAYCKFFCHTQYGFVWFDELKKEVSLYDPDGELQVRQLLFLADSVNNLSVSPCGRFLSISYTQVRNREHFKQEVTLLYDLKNRSFLRTKFYLRDASILILEDGTYAVAGISVKNAMAKLLVYKCGELTKLASPQEENDIFAFPSFGTSSPYEDSLVFSRSYDSLALPFSPVYAGGQKIAFLLRQHGRTYFCLVNLFSKNEQAFLFSSANQILQLERLYSDSKNQRFFMEYKAGNGSSLTRVASLFVDEHYNPQNFFVQKEDFSGGVYSPVFAEEKLYFVSHKFSQDEVRFVSYNSFNFEKEKILVPNIIFRDASKDVPLEIERYPEEESGNFRRFVGEHELSDYDFMYYFLKGGWNFFNPVKNISLEKGVEKSPGAGVSFETSSDLLSGNTMILCAGLFYLPLDFTKIFNATQKSLEELEEARNDFYKNFTFAAYFENSSTPVDLSLSGIFRFNTDGQYDFKVLGGANYMLPLRMNFRKFTVSLKGMFSASTTFWDVHQSSTYPDLADWPLLSDSYRSVEALLYLDYTNIHQYGVSAFKKLGINMDVLVTSIWDVNLFELQKKNGVNVARAQTLNDAIKNQLWGTYAPSQINMGVASTIEIPHILPIANNNGWILSFPSSLHAELFYTNGTALDVCAKILVAGKEIQNGWAPSKLFFQRAGMYFGYEIAFEYDTNTVVLPDLRDFTRFYTVFANTHLNDSIFVDFVIDATPLVGEASKVKSELSLMAAYYMQTKEFKLSLGFKFN